MTIGMLAKALVIDAERTPDWDAAFAAGAAYTPEPDDDLNYFDDPHETLRKALRDVREALDGGEDDVVVTPS